MKNTFYRRVLNSDLLNIDLPEELRNKKVELIILSCEDENKVNNRKELLDNVKGIWSDLGVDLNEIREKAWKR